MSDDPEAVFLVDAGSDLIQIRVNGRANFLNCSPLRTFLQEMSEKGKQKFTLDFSNCVGMDSTFLGILAGAAIDMKRQKPAGKITLTGLGIRNLDLVKNLGLDRIVDIAEYAPTGDSDNESHVEIGLTGEAQSEAESTKMVLGAHESLVEADHDNIEKFEDVILFLKNQVGK